MQLIKVELYSDVPFSGLLRSLVDPTTFNLTSEPSVNQSPVSIDAVYRPLLLLGRKFYSIVSALRAAGADAVTQRKEIEGF